MSRATAPAAPSTDRSGWPRLRPVPQTDPPPIGCEHPEHHPRAALAVSPGQQVLTFGRPWWDPQQEQTDPEVAARPSADHDLDDPAPLCRTLASALVEVISGRRQVAQMVRWTTEEVHTNLRRRAALVARLSPNPRSRPAVVHSTHVSRPAAGVVGACAVVIDNGRVRAVAIRLEGWDRRWRITAVEIG